MKLISSRIILGFLIAPAIPSLIIFFIGLLFYSPWEAAWAPKIFTVFAYISIFLFGIPAHIIFNKNKINNAKNYLFLGGFVGLICYVIFYGLIAISSTENFSDHIVLLFKNSISTGFFAVAYGAITGFSFWFVVFGSKKIFRRSVI